MKQNLENFWDERIQTLKQWRKLHPAYAPKIYMVMKKFQAMQIAHIKLLQEYHYQNKKSALIKAEQLVEEAEQLYKKLSKLEMIATLTK
jgi:oligoribonuclease NrnB/cAMP/cGMP phosphodiesterase (DHH superfamily)